MDLPAVLQGTTDYLRLLFRIKRTRSQRRARLSYDTCFRYRSGGVLGRVRMYVCLFVWAGAFVFVYVVFVYSCVHR